MRTLVTGLIAAALLSSTAFAQTSQSTNPPPPAAKGERPASSEGPDFALAVESENADVPALAATLLAILEREQTAGNEKVSTRSLRKELACGEAAFDSVRIHLAGRVQTEGRSLRLAPKPAA